MNGDGRLDLDDLGAVIESARRIDEPADVVGDEAGRTWGERLESAGITPWLRRHRVAVGAATATLVVVVVGAGAWVSAQPPPWREAQVSVVQASVDDASGPFLTILDDDVPAAAYVLRADDPGTTVRLDGLQGPGIRASSVGAPHPQGNQDATLVRAVIGCDDSSITATTSDFRLRITTTDIYGRARSGLADIPRSDFGWPDHIRQTCWQRAVLDDVQLTAASTRIDQGAAAVLLELDVRSTMSYDAIVRMDGAVLDRLMIPWSAAVGTLGAGRSTSVSTRLEVEDCTDGPPPLPTVTAPDNLSDSQSYLDRDGVGLVVVSTDQQVGAVVPFVFDDVLAAEVRRALAEICRSTPTVTVTDARIVRTEADPATGTTLTLAVDATVAGTRIMKVGISQDPFFGTPDPGLVPWATLPPGGGTATVTWTFECTANPAPPSLDIRFVDGLRPTPLTVPLDQETVAPWVSDACPLLTADTLVELGWALP